MADEGFSANATAIQVVMLENWLVDYYSSSPTSPADIKNELEHLHFDNLPVFAKVNNYWAALTNNTKAEVQKVAREIKASPNAAGKNQIALKMLALMGVSLHAVQDFYTHSNWTEIFNKTDSYQSNTWFDTPDKDKSSIRTGTYPSAGNTVTDHGSYDSGMNQDSYNRPRFPQAYVFSYSASRQWIKAMKAWSDEIDPAVWSSVRNYSVSGDDVKDLSDDLNASYRISEWLSFKFITGKNGAWKGKGSGSSLELPIFLAKWTSPPDSTFIKLIKARIYAGLIPGLNAPSTPVELKAKVPAQVLGMKTVEVGTTAVAQIDSMDGWLGKPDFYAILNIDNQPFVEAMQKDTDNIAMQIDTDNITPKWLSIRFIPAAQKSATIKYALLDEDGGLSGKDDTADIHPVAGKTALQFNIDTSTNSLSGDLTGSHSSKETPVESKGAGDANRARVSIFATSNKIAN